MDVRTWNRRGTLTLVALALVSLLGRETLRAEGERSSANQNQTPELHSLRAGTRVPLIVRWPGHTKRGVSPGARKPRRLSCDVSRR